MTSFINQPEGRPGRHYRQRFGGWPDYQQWAKHDFRPMTPADGQDDVVRSTVPAPIVLAPIRLPQADFGIAVGVPSSYSCRLVPFPPQVEAVMDSDTNFHDDTGGDEPDSEADSALIRPYVRSKGRAEAAHELEFETVLTTTGLCDSLLRQNQLTGDQLVICEQCVVPQSVAEIAVAISAPLGLATVLISDAIDAGLLVVHPTAPVIDGRPSMDLLRRVHAGIAKLA